MAKLALLVALVRPLPPYQEEMRRFPDERVTAECLQMPNRYVEWSRRRQAGMPTSLRDEADEDVLSGQWCQEAWSKLDDYHRWGIRSCAGELRDMLGDDSFFKGRMPPPVPLWRFRSVD